MRVIAGERILVGEPIFIGNDGKAYRCSKAFKGKIPPIAEKEKLGKKVKIPKGEEYILEITSKCGLSIDPNSNVEFNISTSN